MPDNPILKNIADNSELLSAVKEVVLGYFNEGPYSDGASDELLGQITRARISGRKKVEDAFLKIASMKTIQKPTEEPQNPAY
ncbi:MAG: hypothetical protein KBD16_00630 [Candidatus Pacebacteria bacterium]|nr:hypothetical protein [Candidatus Paceibacterota bacterium]